MVSKETLELIKLLGRKAKAVIQVIKLIVSSNIAKARSDQ